MLEEAPIQDLAVLPSFLSFFIRKNFINHKYYMPVSQSNLYMKYSEPFCYHMPVSLIYVPKLIFLLVCGVNRLLKETNDSISKQLLIFWGFFRLASHYGSQFAITRKLSDIHAHTATLQKYIQWAWSTHLLLWNSHIYSFSQWFKGVSAEMVVIQM